MTADSTEVSVGERNGGTTSTVSVFFHYRCSSFPAGGSFEAFEGGLKNRT